MRDPSGPVLSALQRNAIIHRLHLWNGTPFHKGLPFICVCMRIVGPVLLCFPAQMTGVFWNSRWASSQDGRVCVCVCAVAHLNEALCLHSVRKWFCNVRTSLFFACLSCSNAHTVCVVGRARKDVYFKLQGHLKPFPNICCVNGPMPLSLWLFVLLLSVT